MYNVYIIYIWNDYFFNVLKFVKFYGLKLVILKVFYCVIGKCIIDIYLCIYVVFK